MWSDQDFYLKLMVDPKIFCQYTSISNMALALDLRKWNGKVFGEQLFSSKTCFEVEPIGSTSMLKIVFKRFANSLLQTEAVLPDIFFLI